MSDTISGPHGVDGTSAAFSEAQRLRQRGEFASAAECLARAIACSPLDPVYHLELAVVFLSDQKPMAAVQEFKRARIFGPDNPNCALGAGLAYADMGDHRRAITELEAARASFPDSVRLLTALGRCYRLQNDRQKALECLQTALEVNPQATSALAEMALARQAVSAPPDPHDEAPTPVPEKHRVEVVPKVKQSARRERRAEYRRRAEEALQVGRQAEAFEALRQALLDGERDDRLAFNLYECGRRARLFEPLRETLTEVLRHRPRWAAVQAVLGMVLHDQGQLAEAEQHYLRARKLKIAAEGLDVAICGLFLDTERPELAVRIARQGLKKWPKSVDLNYRLGLACFRLGRKKESVQALQRVVAVDPNNVPALCGLAQLFAEHGSGAFHTVEKYLRRALEVDRRNVEAHIGLIALAIDRKDPQTARRQAEEARLLGLSDPRLTEIRQRLRLRP